MPSQPSWQKISAIFDEALEHPSGKRAAWVKQACLGDAALLREVETLLAAHERAEGVLEQPLQTIASEALRVTDRPATGDELVGPYRIVSEIGRGGMGVVYKAEDPRLGRFVALKFLPPHLTANERAKQRFLSEARAASVLDHPNICTIHDIGQTEGGRLFFAMAYYEGQTLAEKIEKAPLPIEEALSIAESVADGLSHAHDARVMHRDIKPSNVLLTSKGQVKILDFGLAKRELAPISDPDSRVGTIAYMSPEQASGTDADHRTDLWSLGVTLYEMIAGRPPFGGDYTEAIIYSILNEEPEPLTALRTGVPVDVERVVLKALEKSREQRYQHADDLAVDLRQLRQALKSGSARVSGVGRAGPVVPSIAVLPFVNMNRDEESEFFADGMTEDITSALTNVEGLRVAAYSSALAFKGKAPDIREVGRRLRVEHVLLGSVRRMGSRLRITVRLSSVEGGSDVWSERFDRVMEDVFDVQEQISHTVADTLRGRLVGEHHERLARRYTKNVDAYNLYLKGRFYWNKRRPEEIAKAKTHFEEALAKDPDYALALSGLADCYVALAFYGVHAPTQVLPQAKGLALKALQLDSTLAEAHASLAFVDIFELHNWREAERELAKAIQLNPEYATAHFWLGVFAKPGIGQPDEGVDAARRAQQIDPVTPVINVGLGLALLHARRYEEAISELQKALELQPDYHWGLLYLGRALVQQGEYEKGIAALERAELGMFRDGHLGFARAVYGQRESAEELLHSLLTSALPEYVSAYQIALIYCGLGDANRAIEWLERAYENRSSQLVWLGAVPEFDGLRSDPRFPALLEKMNFAPALTPQPPAVTPRPPERPSLVEPLDLQIRFCKTQQGVRLAYATIGKGPALVLPPGWISHLEEAWKDPRRRAFYEELARRNTVVLYDKHGSGLSDRDRTDFSLEAELVDLEAVVGALELERLALLGLSQGGPVAVAYAARHPDRVTHLILFGAYARGSGIGDEKVRQSMLSLIQAHWGLGAKALADIFMPGADAAAADRFARLQRSAATADMAGRLLELVYQVDVTDLLPKIQTPTLVIHRERDRAIAFQQGRELAQGIPGARLVSDPGRSHFPWLEDSRSVLRAIVEFLASQATGRFSSAELQAPPEPFSEPAIQEKPARASVRLHNFPNYLTSFVGRRTELQALESLLKTTRLLTLTGPGGAGKTRLSCALAQEVADQFAHGACFVALAPLNDSDLVPSTIARVLDVPDSPGVPVLESLKSGLGSKQLLLVLDNFEQVLGAAAVVQGLLAACPGLKVIVSSRAPLRLGGEQEFLVPPLDLPREAQRISLETAERLSAVKLFVERARAARPDFSLAESSARDVAELCARLDGLPLAIELAAARAKLFSPHALLSRLAKRLDFLTGGTHDLPDRHRTLRQAIAWSYELLDEPSQRFFRRMSVFSGGWTLEAAEAASADQPDLASNAMQLLTSLGDQSLIRQTEGEAEEPRFWMLETIRDYGWEQLRQAGEEEKVSRAQADYFLSLAERAEPELTGADQARWLDRLETENGNLRAAFRWMEESGNRGLGVRMGAALWRFWIARGHIEEGLSLLERLLAEPAEDVPPEVRIRALDGLGTLCHYWGQMTKAREVLMRCVELARDNNDKAGVAKALTNLAWVDSELSELGTARALSQEALALHEALGNKRGMALALNNIGWTANYRGDYPTAKHYHERSLALRREIGDQRGIAFALTNLAWAELQHGDLDQADQLLDEAMEILKPLNDRVLSSWALLNRAQVAQDRLELDRAVRILEENLALWPGGGHPTIHAWSRTYLGGIYHQLGEPERSQAVLSQALRNWETVDSPWGIALHVFEEAAVARDRRETNAAQLFQKSLQIRADIGDHRGVAECLEELALLSAEKREHERAAVLLGAAAKLRETLQAPVPLRRRRRVEGCAEFLHSKLAEENYARAHGEGQSMRLEEAVALAMSSE